MKPTARTGKSLQLDILPENQSKSKQKEIIKKTPSIRQCFVLVLALCLLSNI
jgi:hypothetical protein